MKNKYILSIDFGGGKTTALLSETAEQTKIIDEYIFGSKSLVLKDKLNLNLLNIFCEKIRDHFSRHLSSPPEVILSLPSAVLILHKENYSYRQTNFNKIGDLIKRAVDIDHYHCLNPIFNKPEGEIIEAWFPCLEKKTADTLDLLFRKNNMLLKKIYYPLPFYHKFTEDTDFGLLNLGCKTMDLLIYRNNNLKKIQLLKMGGDYILRDIMSVLKLSEDEARGQLFSFQQLFSSFFDNNNKDVLTQVVDARIKEIFNLIKIELQGSGINKLYVFGGLANLNKAPDFLQQYLGIKIINLNQTISEYSFITLQAHLLFEHYLTELKSKLYR